ncbi:MAG: hypothetical protein ABFD75_03085 [Smithella sp.]
MSPDKFIISKDKLKELFFDFLCSTMFMSREGGKYYDYARHISQLGLENQWTQEYFNKKIFDFQSTHSAHTYAICAEVLRNKIKTKKDVLSLIDVTRDIENKVLDDEAKLNIAEAIITDVIPSARNVGLFDEAKEILKIAIILLLHYKGDKNKIHQALYHRAIYLNEASTKMQAKK